jgi:hypothetical protein
VFLTNPCLPPSKVTFVHLKTACSFLVVLLLVEKKAYGTIN